MVHLDRFQFFKSGTADTASNIQLAIVNNFFLNLQTFTTSSPELVGLSTNTIASTASIATGDPITFNFNHLRAHLRSQQSGRDGEQQLHGDFR